MLQKISYHYRVYLAFVMIAFAILSASGLFFYRYNASILRSDMEKSAINSLEIIKVRIEDTLQGMDQIAARIHVSNRFMELIKEIPNGWENYFTHYPRKKAELNELLLSEIVSEKLSMNIHFIGRYYDYMGTFMSLLPYEKKKAVKEELAGLAVVKEGLSTSDYRFFRPPHQSEWVLGGQKVFSVVRPIRDQYQTYGMLEIDLDEKELQELTILNNLDDDYQIYLFDEKGQFLYANKEVKEGKIEQLLNFIKSGQKTSDLLIVPDNQLICYQTSELTGWTIVMERTLDSLSRQKKSLGQMVILIYLCSCVLVIAFLYFISKNLTKPLTRLKENLYHLQMDEEIHLEIEDTSNEVAALAIAIEKILNQIKQQNDTIIQTRKQVIQAHNDMLEAQMNPHFLYNTLTVIGSCGYEDGSRRVYDMCQELSALLRYSIKYEFKMVQMKDELQNIKNYLSIMEKRYEELIDIEWRLDESMEEVRMPKLLLQPLVENCFKHGFVNADPIWRIQICNGKEQDNWFVEIRNSGNPFLPEEIERMKQEYRLFCNHYHSRADEELEKGLGLINTLKRLYLEYGEDSFYQLSVENGWSIVKIGGKIRE